jgi:hypothetical protein
MDPVWKAHKQGSIFEVYDFDGFMLYMGRYQQGEPLEVIVRKPSNPTTTPQMRYYYGVVVKLVSEHIGHSLDETDTLLKWKFLKQEDDRHMEFVPSKNALSTVEFEKYQERVRQWAAIFLDLHIPLPNEVEVEDV